MGSFTATATAISESGGAMCPLTTPLVENEKASNWGKGFSDVSIESSPRSRSIRPGKPARVKDRETEEHKVDKSRTVVAANLPKVVRDTESSLEPEPQSAMPSPKTAQEGQVIFLHPDLGIGGAERLVVDAALGLQEKGFDVTIYTSHHDPSHCFKETRDGTLSVEVRGDLLPRHVFHKGHIVFAMLRSLWAAACIVWAVLRASRRPRAVVVDQLSIAIPLLRLTGCKILFYCHFPDLLLTQRKSFLKKLYRWPVDWLEEYTTGMADLVMVNSQFTASVYNKTFSILRRSLKPHVLYPSINFSKYPISDSGSLPESVMFLSINRFERKKNIMLAIEAFAALQELIAPKSFSSCSLVVAGGYDTRVQENVEYHKELRSRAQSLGLSTSEFPDRSGQVIFLRSFTEEQRAALLNDCLAVLYTPANEHFGIVPIEAMYAKRPVLAVNSGGPLETVKDGKTGYLRPGNTNAFAEAMQRMVKDPHHARAMGENGHQHVIKQFSLDTFSSELAKYVRTCERRDVNVFPCIAVFVGCLACGVGVFCAALCTML